MRFGTLSGLRVIGSSEGEVFYDDEIGDRVSAYNFHDIIWDSSPDYTLSLPNDLKIDASKLGGTRYNAGKPPLALLPAKPLIEIAKILDFGKAKYTTHNWRKGFSYLDTLSSAQRHLAEWQEGEDTDKESGLRHLAHAACNLLFLLEFELTNTGTDDRYKKGDSNG